MASVEREKFGNDENRVSKVAQWLGVLVDTGDLKIGADSTDIDPGARLGSHINLGYTAVRGNMPPEEDDGTGQDPARLITGPTPFPGGSTVEDNRLIAA